MWVKSPFYLRQVITPERLDKLAVLDGLQVVLCIWVILHLCVRIIVSRVSFDVAGEIVSTFSLVNFPTLA